MAGPTLSGIDAAAFLENTVNAAPQIIDADVTVTAPDGGSTAQTLTVDGLLAEDLIAIRNQGTDAGQIGVSGSDVTYDGTVIGSFAGGAGTTLTVTFNAAATAPAIEALIENLTYANASDAPTASRTLSLSITDESGVPQSTALTVTVTAENDPSALTGVTSAVTFLENTVNAAFQVIDADVTFADPDGGFAGRTLRVTGLLFEDRVGVRNQGTGAGEIGVSGNNVTFGGTTIGSGTGGGGTTLTVTFNAAATAAAIDALIQNLTYANVSNAPTASRNFTLTVADAPAVSLTVNVTPQDDLPALSGIDQPLTILENAANAGPRFIDQNVTVTDQDGGFGSYNLTVAGLLPEDRVAVHDQGTGAGQISVSGSSIRFGGTEIGTFTGGVGTTLTVNFLDPASAAAIETLIENLTYANVSDTPTASRTLALTIAGSSGAAPVTMTSRTGFFNPLNVAPGFYSAPTFADLDGDGDQDSIIGVENGTLFYFSNTGTANVSGVNVAQFSQQTGAANPFNGVDVGGHSAPSFGDLDHDGDLDAVVGALDGTLRYFRNTGTASAPVFTEQSAGDNPFAGIDVGNNSTPSLADLDGDGDRDLVVGSGDGTIRYFQNTGSASNPVFTSQTGAANPFEGVDVGDYSAPSFADIDGDGDLDAVIGTWAGTLRYFLNTGTAGNPVFAEQADTASPFFGVNVGGAGKPGLADLDRDGDIDAVAGLFFGSVRFYENTTPRVAVTVNVAAENDAPAVTGVTSSVTFLENTVYATPQIIDADVTVTDPDGGSFLGQTLTVANLLAEDRVGIRNQGNGAGLINLNGSNVRFGTTVIGTFTGGDGTTLTVTFNAATTAPAIEALIENLTYANVSDTPTASRTLALTVAGAPSIALTVNVTAENDPPALSGVTVSAGFLENTVNVTPQIIDPDVTFTDPDDGFAGHTLTVANLLTEDRVAIRNQGTGAGQIGVSGSDVTFGGTVIGNFTGGVGTTLTVTFNAAATGSAVEALIENLTYASVSDTPTASRTLTLTVADASGDARTTMTPRTGGANPFTGIDVGSEAAPSFADLDHDGDLDAVVGAFDGTLTYFLNTGSAAAPTFTLQGGAANPFNGVDVGYNSTPTLADLDGDGDFDAVVGTEDGTLLYFRNTGTAAAPAFTAVTGSANPFNGVDLGYGISPTFADLDGDGDLDAVVGAPNGINGVVHYFRNDGTATAPAFTLQTGSDNPFIGIQLGNWSAPGFADLDHDGDLDAVVGVNNGTLRYFANTGNATAPTFTAVIGADNPLNGVDVGYRARPGFADLDGDGDPDAVLGANDGALRFYENTAPRVAVTVNVTAENDAPAVTGLAPSVAFLENTVNATPQIIDADVTVADPDGGPTAQTLTVTGLLAEDTIAIRTVGIGTGQINVSGSNVRVGITVIGTFAGGVGTTFTVTFNAQATASRIEALIESLTYANTSNTPTASRTLALSITDTSGATQSTAVTITVAPENDPPALSGVTQPAAFLENTVNAVPQLLDADVTFTDIDNGFAGATLTVANLLAEDRVAIRNEGQFAGQIRVSGSDVLFSGVVIGSFTGGVGTTLTVTFTAAATAAAVEAVIQNLTYANVSDTPTASRTLTLTVTDASGNAGVTFAAGTANPLSGVDVGRYAAPTFADIDGDGDLDAVLGSMSGALRYFRNTGTAGAPVLTEQTGADNPFNGINVTRDSVPSFADLDHDGDLDLMVGALDGTLNYFRNTGSATAPAYVAQTDAANPLNGISVSSSSTPSFADLDGDGDLDAVVGAGVGTLRYFRNAGSAAAPVFAEQTGAANPFNGVDVGNFSAPLFSDLDGDGDLDAVVGDQIGALHYFRNTGSAAAPAFTEQTGLANPFNGIDVGAESKPSLFDLDGDGDLDVVVGTQDGTFVSYENTTARVALTVTVTAENDPPALSGINPPPAFFKNATAPQIIDADVTVSDADDGYAGHRLTVANLLSEDRVAIRNQGTGAGQIGVSGSNVTFGGTVIGSFTGGAGTTFTVTLNAAATAAAVEALIENLTYADVSATPTATRTLTLTIADSSGVTPVTMAARSGSDHPLNGVDIGSFSAPSFADIDGDGDFDAVVGASNGNLRYFRNDGTAAAPLLTEQTGSANPFDGINVGTSSRPGFGDLDHDGDLDLVVGTLDGTLQYFRNGGTATAPAYTQQTGGDNPFNGIDVANASGPSLADLDHDGDLDAIVGSNDGTLWYFRNTGTAVAPVFTLQTGTDNPLNGFNVVSFSAPSFADVDQDGDLDAVVGAFDGTVRYLRNTGSAASPVFLEQTGTANPFYGVDLGTRSTPSFADLDHDGDLDAAMGHDDGTLAFFENTTARVALTVNVTATNHAPTLEGFGAAPRFESLPSVDLGFSLTGFVLADDFVLGSAATVRQFAVDLVDGAINNDGVLSTFSGTLGWRIYADNGGHPGALLFSGADTAVDLLDTGRDFANRDLVRATVDIGSIELAAGTYWLALREGSWEAASDGSLVYWLGNDSTTLGAGWHRAEDVNNPTFEDEGGDATLQIFADVPVVTFGEQAVNAGGQLLAPDVTFTDAEGNLANGTLTVTGLTALDVLSIRNQGTGAGQIGVSGNTLTFGNVVVGTFAGGSGNTLTVAFNANATNAGVEALVENLTFANTSDTPVPSRMLTLDIADGAGAHLTHQLDVRITPENDAPVAADNDGAVVAEGGSVVITAAQLRFADPEQAAAAVTYTVTSTTNGAVQLNGSALAVNGTFTQDDIDNGRLTFLHDGSETTSASFGFAVSDGTGGVAEAQSFALAVTPVNDAPVLEGFGAPARFESLPSITASYFLNSNVIADDFTLGTSGTLSGFAVYLIDGAANDDGVLSGFNGTLGWRIYADDGGHPGALLFSGADSSVGLVDTGRNAFAGDVVRATVDIGSIALAAGTYWLALREGSWEAADDGSRVSWAGSASTILGAGLHGGSPINDPAFFENGGDATQQIFADVPVVTFGEQTVNAGGQLLAPDVTFTDAEGNLSGGMLSVSGLAAFDVLSIRNQGTGAGQIGISGTVVTFGNVTIGSAAGGLGNTFTVTFNANATNAAVEALIGNLTFANTSDTPVPSRLLTLDIADGDGAHLAHVLALDVRITPENDAPVAAANGGGTVAEGSAIAITTAQLRFTDPEQAATAVTYTVTSTTNGTVRLNGSALGLNGTFTQDDIDHGRVSFLHDGSETTSASFGFAVSDGAGGVVEAQSFSLAVAPVDDLRVLSGLDPSVAFAENTVNTTPQFLDADVTLSDPDSSFDGHTLTVANLLAEDRVGIHNQGAGAGQIGVAESNVTYGGTVIGSLTGGDGTTLTVTFNAAATAAAVEALIENLTYANVSDTPTTSRTLALSLTHTFYGYPVTMQERTGSANPFNGLSVQGDPNPAVADLDHDGDLDLMVGVFGGTLHYFRNDGTATAPAFTAAAGPLDGIDVEKEAAPTFADLDNDGDLDAVVGNNAGVLRYFRNTGTVTTPVFTEQGGGDNPFNGVDVGSYSAPSFADLDGDGDLDAVVGEDGGTLLYFRNTGTAASPVFTQQSGADNPFSGVDIGQSPRPTFADIDGDGDLDALVGTSLGTIRYFRNDGTAAAPAFVEQTDSANPFTDFDAGLYSTPILADFDGDGDVDVAVGGDADIYRLFFFENTTPHHVSVTVTVTAENDAPASADNTGGTVAEGEAAIITGAQLRFTDPEGAAATTITYTVTSTNNGTVQLNGAALAVNGTFTQDDIDNGRVGFLHDGGETTSASFGFAVSDGAGGVTEAQSFALTVTPVNDAPVLEGFGVPILSDNSALGFGNSNITFAVFANDFVLGSAATLSEFAVYLSDGAFGHDGAFATFSGTLGWRIYADNGGAPGALLFTGADSSVDLVDTGIASTGSDIFRATAHLGSIDLAAGTYWLALREGDWDQPSDGSFVFWERAAAVVGASQQLSPNINDPTFISVSFDSTLQIVADVPVVTFDEQAVNAGGQLLAPDVAFTDAEGNLAGGTLTVTGLVSADIVSIRNQGTGAGQIGVSGGDVSFGNVVIGSFAGGSGRTALTVTFNQNATNAAVDALIENLTFANTSDAPVLSRVLTLDITDGAGAHLDHPLAREVRITPANDAPRLTVNDGVTVAEGGSASIRSLHLQFVDAEQTVEAITYTITSMTNGTVQLDGSPLAVNGTFTQADISIGRVTFLHDGSETTSASFGFAVSDGVGGVVEGQSFALTVTPENDDPVVAVALPDRTSPVNQAVNITIPVGTFSDADNATLTLTAALANGDPLPGTLTFDGTTITGRPPQNFFGDLEIRITASDGEAGVSDTFVLTISNAGNDVLVSGPGPNSTGVGNIFALIGGAGDDVYAVADEEAGITEETGEGADTVYATVTYTLPTNVEGMVLQEAGGAIDGFGSDGNDTIFGNSLTNWLHGGEGSDALIGGGGSDVLIGDAGADGMAGGAGDDTYAVDDSFDQILENPGEGTDTVYASASFTLFANVEGLVLVEGAGAIDGTGSEGNDTIIGNSSNNRLDGGAGSDALIGGGGNDVLIGGAGIDGMAGGTGDDVYGVDNTLDQIQENAGEGADTVYASATFTLTANLEALVLVGGAGAIDGTGNGEDNYLFGNSSANTLHGGGGNDVMFGGAGEDTLTGDGGDDVLVGGADNDRFVFGVGFGRDSIEDFNSGDHIVFSQAVFADFAAVQAHMVTIDASTTAIVLDGANMLAVHHAPGVALTQNDFLFS